MFNKILIANRGEIAVRIMRTCRRLGIKTVAIYSEADARALHTREADEAIPIGPPAPAQSYLRGERIIEVAQATGAEAIHPGFGFLSENAAFARAVRDAGLSFIGPSAEAMAQMGSKIVARSLMEAAGVPVVPGYQGDQVRGTSKVPRTSPGTSWEMAAEQIGYPLLVKASAGGGGKGMRVVHNSAQLHDAIGAAQREARNAFGDDTIFLEKYISNPRHIEFQILADSHGNTLHLFERDCSIQRRYQKIIEESPSPIMTPQLRARMASAAVAAARAVSYENAGTIEFIVDHEGNFYFLEMNTRLQVEHPVTEMVTGLDLVEWQLRIAAGEALPWSQEDLMQRGHAMECRVYAEDPANNFLPDTGTVLLAEEPEGVRVDAGVKTGDEVTIHYDPMISKVIVHAPTRHEALRQMGWALQHYTLLGLITNLSFLQEVLKHPVFRAGDATTHFISQQMTDWQPTRDQLPDQALIALALRDTLAQQRRHNLTRLTSSDPYNPWRIGDAFRIGEQV
ncbi:MAG: acetyl-CoA carboxylase biotin carboxylase subunit [Ardenticatenaceae bacterium]